ncbi:MAG: chorismate mutase [Actinomycetota bacterium]|nr:chorismate mutase [Actinomycetota bacterium]
MSTSSQRLVGIRGAITVDEDNAETIVEATRELLEVIIDRNSLAHADIVSILFTSTPDLTAEFPAVGARRLGLNDVPLLCAQEIEVPGAVAGCIRALVHAYAGADRAVRHVYLRGARELRDDLAE